MYDLQMITKEHISYVDVPEGKTASDFQLALAGDDLLFWFGEEDASADSSEIMTVKMCSLTERYVSGTTYLSRKCEACPSKAPYSGGFQSTQCIPCSQLSEDIPKFKLCDD